MNKKLLPSAPFGEKQKRLLQQLSNSISKTVGLSAFAEYQLNSVSEQLPLPPRKVPHSLTKLYSEQNKTIE